MNLKINKFIFNSTFESIVNTSPTGIIKRCVIPDGEVFSKSADAILYVSHKLQKIKSGAVYLSVKLAVGSRDKRVEIVYKSASREYFLIKCCVSNRFDKEAIELQGFAADLSEKYINIPVYGVVLLCSGQTKTDLSQEFFETNAPMVRCSSISELRNFEVTIGLLNKSKRFI